MVSVSGSTCFSVVRARRGAPGEAENHCRAWELWSAGLPLPASRMRLRTGSPRFPGDPSHTFALFPDPGRTDETSPLAVPSVLPPVLTRRRLQQEHDFEAYPGLRCLLPTLHERRHRRPCKARFRLAGCAFAGRELNPLDRSERFQATSILLSRTFLTQAGSMPNGWCTNSTPSRSRIAPPSRRCGS